MRKQPQDPPEWFVAVVTGLVGGLRDYAPFLVGKRFAIIKQRGHSAYIDRATGTTYCEVQFILVEKGKNYWHGCWEYLHYGRAKKDDVVRLGKALAAADRGMPVKLVRHRYGDESLPPKKT